MWEGLNHLPTPNSPDGFRLIVDQATPALLAAKLLGALAGSLISIAYVLPSGRREAALRLSVGVVTGVIFGGTAGLKIADALGLLGKVSAIEITLTGAAAASLCAWWSLGAINRLLAQFPRRTRYLPTDTTDKKDLLD